MLVPTFAINVGAPAVGADEALDVVPKPVTSAMLSRLLPFDWVS